jgi:GMP synthase-like glutamine amidotransferase
MILIVDMNWKQDSLAYNEFVAPIVAAVECLEECEVMHFSELSNVDFSRYSKVILSGTTLKDFTTLKHLDKFGWIKTLDKPILGICAGLETIAMVSGVSLKSCLQVGMIEITTTATNPLFEGDFKAYALHSLTVEPSDTFIVLAKSDQCIEAVKQKDKPIYGVLFHPEVRNPQILSRFVQLK